MKTLGLELAKYILIGSFDWFGDEAESLSNLP